MALAPVAKKKSAAQAAAGVKFAAGGRAAQARKRSAARVKGLPTASKAQHQAALRWAAAGRAAQKARKAGKVPVKKAAAVLAPDAPARAGGYWLAGCNDMAPSCASAAVANHLLAATGRRMSDADVLALHRLAGDDDGASIASVLEVLRGRYLATSCGLIRVSSFTRADENVLVAGLVVGTRLPHARHAVLSHPRGMVSWGRVMPWTGLLDEAWAVEWCW